MENIGDVHSDQKGSGARYQDGKPNWALMPLSQVALYYETYDDGRDTQFVNPVDLINVAADFQAGGTLPEALQMLFAAIDVLRVDMDCTIGDAFVEVIRVWEHGEEKYAAFNWMKGMSWSSVLACYMRHLIAMLKGEMIDQESGRHHGAHLVCNAMMLVHYVQYYPEGADLPTKWFK